MPNWCNNLLVVETGTSPFDLDDFWLSCRPGYVSSKARPAEKVVAALTPAGKTEIFSFQVLVPEPDDLQGDEWYRWRLNNWGTKWDASDVVVSIESNDLVQLYFETAWGPPVEWFRKFVERHPGWTSRLVYAEQGNWFAGVAENRDGEIVDREAAEGEQRKFLARFGVEDWWPEFDDEDDSNSSDSRQ